MTSMPSRVGAAMLAALSFAVAGCGEDDGDGERTTPPPVARPGDFPDPRGKTIAELRRELGPGGPVLAASVSDLEPGRNRFGFGLFDRARKQITDAKVALYLAPTGGGRVEGPFPARWESLAVKPQFESRGTASDRDAARSVYVADLPLRKPGTYELLGVVSLDDRLVAASTAGGAVKVVRDSRVPEVGERVPKISTPTEESVGGDLEQIDTRVPPGTMHEADFADVVGKRPAMLLFATPALCQSRVCGPVVDVAEEVKAKRGEDAEFIHMEIYNDNELEKGFRPQVLEWSLPTEPWAFAIDRDGRVAARLEGAFSAKELEAALDRATR